MAKKRRKSKSKKKRSETAAAEPRTATPQATPPVEPVPQGAPATLARRGAVESYLFGGVEAARPFLLLRMTLVLLAFDCWLDLVPHGGRYGVGNFNVAHFAVLDVLLPTPSPAIYVGTLLLTGLLAMVLAVRPWRPGLAVLCGLYTYAWAMSMLDSYQHHYLLSLILFSFALFPTPSSRAVFGACAKSNATSGSQGRGSRALPRIAGAALGLGVFELTGVACDFDTPLAALGGAPWVLALQSGLVIVGGLILYVDSETEAEARTPRSLTSAVGYVSVGITCSIVYFYTAITKLSPDWRGGAALRRLGSSDAFLALERQATGDGLPLLGPLPAEDFWALMARGAIAVQLASAVAFVAAARQDAQPPKRQWIIAAMGLAPLSFHIGAERMGLEIGWFSYYMLMISFVFFAPAAAVHAFGDALTWPARAVHARIPSGFAQDGAAWAVALCAAAAAVVVLDGADLPGSPGAGIAAALLVGAAAAWFIKRDHASDARALGLGLLLATVLCGACVRYSDVRFDYYRFVGGDHRRRGEYEAALEAYVRAQKYCHEPWCVRRGRETLACFATEAEAFSAASELGDDTTVRPADRREKIEEMRMRLGQRDSPQ